MSVRCLDITLAASLLKAVAVNSQVLFIGDADQLPSVGAGNVLRDLLASRRVACFQLNKIFRQAEQSLIIRYAHQINAGQMPYIDSPFKNPDVWHHRADCIFVDSDEATNEQLSFITKVKRFHTPEQSPPAADTASSDSPYEFRINEPVVPYETEFSIPPKFRHVDLEAVCRAGDRTQELRRYLKRFTRGRPCTTD